MSRVIAVLRPEPGNRETVERVRQAGFVALAMPLFEVRSVPWTLPGRVDADLLLLTSANAVRHAGPGLDRLRHLPVIAVGDATAQAARAAGLAVALVGSGGVDAALRLMPDTPRRRILHLCGRHHVASAISAIERVMVYESVAIALPREAVLQLDGAVALLHSARAAAHLGEIVDSNGLGRSAIRLACLSAAVAERAGRGWAASAIATAPTDAALIAAAGRLTD